MKANFSSEGLARMRAALADHVAAGELPGLVSLVSRGGEVLAALRGLGI